MMQTSLAGVPNVLFADMAVAERLGRAVTRRLFHDWHIGWSCVRHGM